MKTAKRKHVSKYHDPDHDNMMCRVLTSVVAAGVLVILYFISEGM